MVIIQNHSHFSLGEISASHDKLPVGNYALQFDRNTGSYFLMAQPDFKLPTKLYGDFSFIERWKKSYENNSAKNLGILLSGTKGTGKTIAAQLFCRMMNKPVIFITQAEAGPNFEAFISNPIFAETIIFIDEFEKVYRRDDDTNSLLTLMDGMYHTKLIFLLTANDPTSINNKLQNRLNRIKYHKIYDKLDTTTINEVVDDLLVKTEHRPSIDRFIETFDMMTMDVLTSVIREVNLFDQDAITCAKYLNLIEEPEYYKIVVNYKGADYRCDGQFVNYRKKAVQICYYRDAPDDLTEELQDYTNVKIFDYPYNIVDGVVVCQYSENIIIKLQRGGNFSLAY